MTVLEDLHTTRDRIADPGQTFVFKEWETCLCGHLFQTAEGRRADNDGEVRSTCACPQCRAAVSSARYRALLDAISPAGAHGVSDAVVSRRGDNAAAGRSADLRMAALSVLDETIAGLEGREFVEPAPIAEPAQAAVAMQAPVASDPVVAVRPVVSPLLTGYEEIVRSWLRNEVIPDLVNDLEQVETDDRDRDRVLCPA